MLLWWCVQLPPGSVNEWQVSQIKEGMTKKELVAAFGEPLAKEDLLALSWEYAITPSWIVSPKASVVVIFDDQDRVEGTLRMEYVDLSELGLVIDP